MKIKVRLKKEVTETIDIQFPVYRFQDESDTYTYKIYSKVTEDMKEIKIVETEKGFDISCFKVDLSQQLSDLDWLLGKRQYHCSEIEFVETLEKVKGFVEDLYFSEKGTAKFYIYKEI